jgi:lipopolysaccharide/colanic/teichoic acid biosynthesis glycosyltransferase
MNAPGVPALRAHRVRRALDLLVASMALVALAPVYLLIAILVKLDSKGPVLVTQLHFSRNGRRFSIPKFRTMHGGGRPQLVALSAYDRPGAVMHEDPRLTRAGRFLRRLGLDELPTLWSVLIGDMSLCGPRPLPAREPAGAWQPRRLRSGPGLTPPWQRRPGSPAPVGKAWSSTRSED